MDKIEIGKRVKSIRLRKKMTQQQVADLANITKSHVSKIENGQASPALTTLSKIAKALDSPTSWFIDQEEHGDLTIVRQGQREAGKENNGLGYDYELLANKMNLSFISPTVVTVLPEAVTIEPYVHPNDEFIFILSGSIKLMYGSKEFVLLKGDSAYFSGRTPHIFLPESDETAKVLTIYIEES
ncbi:MULTISPECIES: helix-turn-helix domain-containing protein [Sporosarcina]|uniref:Helix-turn-helix domain-containing protein n=1 Tax=Sporosarcina contaminans TaxID=633403 RepID=A0ABW3U279_9BACL